ncbi:hypothetical protein BG005_005516 [Podila minutissima]|nr:hypothetical protein BG005_005516 [Podila minutissima]
MFHSVAHLRNLRTLHWGAEGMTIHVDDILRVLKSCPRLIQLHLGNVNVVYVGHDSQNTINRFHVDPPGPLVPIPDEDVDTLYCGHQLEELTLDGTEIADEGLLRLLGIDIEPVHDHNTIDSSPALIQLVVNSFGPTHKSGARILQECRRLEIIGLRLSRMATIELFQGDAVWPSAPSIKELCLDIKVPELNSSLFHHNHRVVMEKGFPEFSTMEQHQIWSRLQSMVSIRHLKLTGYPIDFAVVDDMSFAKQLKSASVKFTFRVPIEEMESEKPVLTARAEEWMARNPQGWSYGFDESFLWAGPKLELIFG